MVRSAKDGGWIDVYENKGKTTGAYSNGSAYGVHPYVLLNFRPELDGLLTLAHEMGHAMHSYYSNHTQPFIKSDYAIFVAEAVFQPVCHIIRYAGIFLCGFRCAGFGRRRQRRKQPCCHNSCRSQAGCAQF